MAPPLRPHPPPPLEGGRFGVAWRVASPDAHPISGAFTFAVAATSAAGPTPESGEAASAPRPPGATGGGDTQPTVNASDADGPLTRALEAADDRGAMAVGGVGRALGCAGGLLAIGGPAFAAMAAIGPRRELTRLFSAVRLAGAVALLGGAIGLVGRTRLLEGGGLESAFSGSAVRDELEGEAGLSLALTAAGGLLVALGARAAFRPAPRVAIDVGSWDSNRATRIIGGSIGNARWPSLAPPSWRSAPPPSHARRRQGSRPPRRRADRPEAAPKRSRRRESSGCCRGPHSGARGSIRGLRGASASFVVV